MQCIHCTERINKWDLFNVFKGWFDIQKLMIVVNYSKKLKKEHYLIISVTKEKIEKIQN